MKLRSLTPVLATAVAITAGGCGGGDKEKVAEMDPVAAVRSAAESTRQAGTSKLDTVMTMKVDAKEFTVRSTGGFDFNKRMGTLTVEMPPEMGVTVPVKEVITPTMIYLKGATPGEPEKWTQLDVTKLGGGLLSNGGGTDPSFSFEILSGAAGEVKRIGEANVRGEPATHYEGTIDLAKAVEQAPDEVRPSLSAAVKSFQDELIPFHAYIDKEGRLRKVEQVMNVSMPIKGKSAPQVVPVTSVMELYDFGTPVAVQVPEVS